MPNRKVNLTDFKNILVRFFDKEFVLSDKMLLVAENFLFATGRLPAGQPKLADALVYLKDIMKRNDFATLEQLKAYYDRKRKKANNLFNKLEEIDPEECFALRFQEACTMYMKPIEKEHKFKSDRLYYLHQPGNCCDVEIHIVDQCRQHSIAPLSALSEEAAFLSQVKGNSLVCNEPDCCGERSNTSAAVAN